jgi:hypothetical protein
MDKQASTKELLPWTLLSHVNSGSISPAFTDFHEDFVPCLDRAQWVGGTGLHLVCVCLSQPCPVMVPAPLCADLISPEQCFWFLVEKFLWFLAFLIGSGKTYTMQPLPLRATQDIMTLMQQPKYRSQGLQLWLSFFEIYGGKLYDLLNERRCITQSIQFACCLQTTWCYIILLLHSSAF